MKRYRCTINLLMIMALLLASCLSVLAQKPGENVMRVEERGPDDKAKRITLDFVNVDLPSLMRFLSTETNLTIIAAEEDIRDKKISLVNLKNVTVDQALEQIKSGLSQLGLTTIQTDRTIIITTIAKAVRMKVPVFIGKEPEKIEPTDQVITQVMPLQYASAQELVNAFKNMVSQSAVIFADTNTNSLVMTDVASNIRRIAEVVSVIDAEPEVPIKVKIIELKYADATSLAQTLQQVFQEEGIVQNVLRKVRGRRPKEAREIVKRVIEGGGAMDLLRGRIEISADVNTNSLIVKASEENIAYIEGLVKKLDRSPTANMEMKMFKLKYAIAEDVANMLDELLGTGARTAPEWERWRLRMWSAERRWRMRREGVTMAGMGIIGEVRVTAETRLNAVIVVTDPRNFPIIEDLINQLDQYPAEQQQTVRLYLLKNADAQTVVDNLQSLLEGVDRNLPWWVRERRRPEEAAGVAGIQGTVNMVADDRLNAVIVATNPQNFPVIDKLIEQMDQSIPEQEWATKVYKLKYADAENVAQIISNMYGTTQRGPMPFFFIPRRQRRTAGGSLAGNVSAVAYPTLNAVIVSTSPAKNFELIDQFIRDLDVPTPEEHRETTVVYQLEYSDAQELADLLNTMWQSGLSRRSMRGRFSFFRFLMGGQIEQKDINTLAGQVDIAADTNTNSLLITTPKRNVEEVLNIIKQLDVSRGQVWLDISILEVTLDNDTKLGLELALKEKRIFGVDRLTGEINSTLQLKNELMGFTYSLATKEYQALLYSLMKENKVRTLASPSILVRDNKPATISIGKNIPYLERTQISPVTEAETLSFAYLENVGINIDIIPHISRAKATEEGKRTIGLEINQINTGDLLEYTTFNAPVTSSTTFSTYIDVEDGQQIVIGGMIREKRQKTTHQVPILGSIPLIGRLFKKTDDVVENTEIIVLITPHIVNIKSEQDKEMLKKRQAERFGKLEEETKQGSEPKE
jgi:type II secretion system protein D